ncbi:hypothetical protein L6164_002721 [Bauhinia variegata]|uniref:Uncharacterized protein n=1 Tax=Bauhinia variegata TaxID=167791 RepID=A0ACB9Q0X1_BAUVA|nr:hypothetical protein L6164_002721 [Bauhinia variegata]
MELHLLPMFLCLILVPVVIHAALPPELYWKSKLPNTTMPKAVKDILSTGNVRKAIYQDPKNQIFIWRHGTAPVCHFSPADNVLWTANKDA